jgi:hypothetical protein
MLRQPESPKRDRRDNRESAWDDLTKRKSASTPSCKQTGFDRGRNGEDLWRVRSVGHRQKDLSVLVEMSVEVEALGMTSKEKVSGSCKLQEG